LNTSNANEEVNAGELRAQLRVLKAKEFWMQTPVYFMWWILQFLRGDVEDPAGPEQPLHQRKEALWQRLLPFGPRALNRKEYHNSRRTTFFRRNPFSGTKSKAVGTPGHGRRTLSSRIKRFGRKRASAQGKSLMLKATANLKVNFVAKHRSDNMAL
jgi:hypothetical protein